MRSRATRYAASTANTPPLPAGLSKPGYEWLELHFAHGYLGASFYSPLANHRTDEYGGSLRNRARFLLEALDAVREVWPERLPLTARLGSDDFHPGGVTFEESLQVLRWMKERGLDLADLSMGGNTDDMRDPVFVRPSGWVERGAIVRREVGIPVTVSWNLGVPRDADRAIRDEKIDLVLLGRPALANPYWPVWAARELGVDDEWSLLPEDWAWWIPPVEPGAAEYRLACAIGRRVTGGQPAFIR